MADIQHIVQLGTKCGLIKLLTAKNSSAIGTVLYTFSVGGQCWFVIAVVSPKQWRQLISHSQPVTTSDHLLYVARLQIRNSAIYCVHSTIAVVIQAEAKNILFLWSPSSFAISGPCSFSCLGYFKNFASINSSSNCHKCNCLLTDTPYNKWLCLVLCTSMISVNFRSNILTAVFQ